VNRTTILHLIGYPGVGKYTIATELARQADATGTRLVVVDNHLTSNVIFAVLPVDGVQPLPPTVWDRVGEIRETLLRTIEELSPPDWSFIFTNVLTQHAPADASVVDRLISLAANRNSSYIPVRITCQTDELVRRVPRADRHTNRKWIDPEGVRDFVESTELLVINHPLVMDLDVTSTSPEIAATRILDYAGTVESSSG
jgi:hypothetical protein